MMHELVIKWAMSSSVLKWHSSCITALLRFVGSRHMCNFRLPDLFLPSTRMKLLIHGVVSVTGLMTLAWSILSISFLKASLRWIGTGLHGVCFGVTFISTCMWYSKLGNLLIPLNTSRYLDNICSLLVIVMTGSCFRTVFLDLNALLGGCCFWSDTSCWDWWSFRAVIFVFLGWSMVLVTRLAHGGR